MEDTLDAGEVQAAIGGEAFLVRASNLESAIELTLLQSELFHCPL
jgi:hypothetical protein